MSREATQAPPVTRSRARTRHPLPDGLRVLDVREQVEWVHGHIEGAQHIPLSELGGRLDEVPVDQTLVVCKVGGRSARAVAWLAPHGRDVVNKELVKMTKLRTPPPPPANIKDLASSKEQIQQTWDEADRESREDAPTRRRSACRRRFPGRARKC
jgi:rhodanese-related sulfurtransferase